MVKCLNCGHEFRLTKTYADNFGVHTECPKCNASFDTDKEVEMSLEQMQRNEAIYDAVWEMCKVMAEDDDLEYNMFFIGQIADFAANTLLLTGRKVRFPSIVTRGDGSQWIEEYQMEEYE